MAKVSVIGLDGLIVEMERADARLKERITTAMDMAAGVVEESISSVGAANFKGKKPSVPLESLVKRGTMRSTGDAYIVEVWPQGSYTGTRGKPRRAETVAFVQEYGRTGMEAKPWIKPGTRRASKKVNSILAEVVKGGTV